MHVLPRVRQLHERFADVVEVIGIHSGKFSAERRTERIALACERLGVTHPVMNDRQFRVWRDYAVQAWPTVAIVDTEGYLVQVRPGEFSLAEVAETIEAIVERAAKRGTLRAGTSPHRERPSEAPGLRFPTRAVVHGPALWVSDSGNGRVLECEWRPAEAKATVVREYPGFIEPRGIAPTADGAFVADRAGHRIWRISRGAAEPVAGTGEMGEFRIVEGRAIEQALRSPWGLAELDGGSLAIAMAGSHQLWRLEPQAGSLSLLAGTGAEDLADGRPLDARLAQPTGIATAGGEAVFADCESSAVRVFSAAGVRTIVGTGLFDFGDRPGTGDEALLQHCEDVAVHGGALAVADTYNDRLKLVDPGTRECVPWAGAAGEAGAFLEPGGVSSHPKGLLVADTGNHRIALVDDGGEIRDLALV